MSTINLYEAYGSKRRKFGVNDAERFRSAFVDAVNLVYAEINDQVFQNQTLDYIGSFNDIIDTRLTKFTSMTFDSASGGPNKAIQSREFWSVEYDLELTSATNGFTDTITDGGGTVVVSVANNVLSVAGSTVSATTTLPTADTYSVEFESYTGGNRLFINGTEYSMTYTVGDADTTQAIGEVSAHAISGVTGFEFKATRFYTLGTLAYEFLFDAEDPITGLTDTVGAYVATLIGAQWDARWAEPSSGLDSQYRSPFNMGLDYHLQDGNEFAIEVEPERERKWYVRGIPMARNIMQNNTTYTNPLGI